MSRFVNVKLGINNFEFEDNDYELEVPIVNFSRQSIPLGFPCELSIVPKLMLTVLGAESQRDIQFSRHIRWCALYGAVK